jgi:hypothetical protein
VELTVDNNLAPYIQSQFNKSLIAAGNYAAIFGLLNFFSRPGGVPSHCMISCFLHWITQHLRKAGSVHTPCSCMQQCQFSRHHMHACPLSVVLQHANPSNPKHLQSGACFKFS